MKAIVMACLWMLGITFAGVNAAADSSDAGLQDTNNLVFETIEWPDLMPPEVLAILLNPPEYIAEIEDGSAEDQISSQIKSAVNQSEEDAYQQALVSTDVNETLDGAMIRIPGFVVPLEFDEEQTISQFFLVPYFGACLHMPPPPPNQIILVNAPKGIQMSALYDPFWIEGQLSTSFQENDMATSAYAMQLQRIEPYSN
ncbi:DUF3299 domain-containing protein [Luminiphilus sp.]|jgi:hypothetical protein|nr:DUF3299 domain-containing protein [Luminiphilus sp.]MDA9666867.1 DUF3299 domain-containing protein [Luminiphilus sp.]